MASSDKRIWYVSANSVRLCPTAQWRAPRRCPSPHTTSQPKTHQGMARAVSASGLRVRGVGRADTFGTMDQLTDDLQRAMEGKHATMPMIAHAEPASTGLAPLLLNV